MITFFILDLREINSYRSHVDKLKLISRCWNEMVKILLLTPGENTGADDLIPIWIHILLLAQPRFMRSNVKYWDDNNHFKIQMIQFISLNISLIFICQFYRVDGKTEGADI